jgi:hypothetical protein|tara:strand:+ start:1403 stop:1804 length:402 start_codon:yes stop_codon:yes gene_type:complete
VSIKIDQAFIQSFIDGAYGLETAYQNQPYTPTAGTPYAQLLNIPNDITALDLKSTNETDGLFRIILRYPVDSGAFAAKNQAETIMADYSIGSSVSYSGQSARITAVNRQQGVVEESWYVTLITISYRAFIPRN